MRATLAPATPETIALIMGTTPETLASLLAPLRLGPAVEEELLYHWPDVAESPYYRDLLARLVDLPARDRGHPARPVPIWPDLNDDGPPGRLLYFYAVALAYPGWRQWMREHGCSDVVLDDTITALARHAATHRRKWATTGVDAGWWLLFLLRGEMVHVGSLKFHRYVIGESTLTPAPWLTPMEEAQYGAGFRHGDEALGIHIPDQTDLSPAALDATLRDARTVLTALWPPRCRRIATCQSWLMDDRLGAALGEESRAVQFQARFTLLPRWADDRHNVLYFVFGRADVDLGETVPTSRLQRVVRDTLLSGDAWRDRVGWFDFDGQGDTAVSSVKKHD